MRAFSDVYSQVYFPEKSAVKFVRLENGFIRETGIAVILTGSRLMQYNLILAVAVEVADGSIVGPVAFWGLKRD